MRRGGHVVADANAAASDETAAEAAKLSSKEMEPVDGARSHVARQRSPPPSAARFLQFGGFDSVINTAAIYLTPDFSVPAEAVWSKALHINVTLTTCWRRKWRRS